VQKIIDLLAEFESINEKFADPVVLEDPDKMDQLINKQGDIQNKIDQVGGWELDSKLEKAMDALRTPPCDMVIKHISGGEKRRVALCRLLLQEPDVLLLDEPTNHLDAESILWLENHLQQYKGTVIAVTHDRYFLDNVAGWILELDRGEGIPWKGNYSSWLEQKQNRLKQEEKSQSKRQKTLERELEWIRMTPKAKHNKSKARLSSYEKLLKEESKQKEERLELYIPPGERLGEKVIISENISKAFGDKLLFEGMNFNIPKGAIVGVIGPNGAGKSTLFNIITEKEEPDSGTIEIGSSVDISYVDQEHEFLDPDKSVWETISEGEEWISMGDSKMNSRAYVSRFNFSGADQEKNVSALSGGERNRVHLALALKKGANLILLDEPTNDLDVNTLRSLEEALENFGGCAIIISHDRWFLDRVATHILAFEGDSRVYWYEGNFSEYEANKLSRLGDISPKRIRYKPLN
jgi:ATP-binding cassette ChvD family protein